MLAFLHCLQIQKVDGKILGDIDISAQITKGSTATGGPDYVKAERASPAFADLSSFISLPRPGHTSTLTLWRVDLNQTTQFVILVSDTYLNSQNQTINRILQATYRLVKPNLVDRSR